MCQVEDVNDKQPPGVTLASQKMGIHEWSYDNDICPMDCITFTENGEEEELRGRLNAPATNLGQDLYIGNSLKTGRIMAKDEDVCLHCGLCAERCPTGAWDMRKFLLDMAQAGPACRSRYQASTISSSNLPTSTA